jgi:hypothetical protein
MGKLKFWMEWASANLKVKWKKMKVKGGNEGIEK